MDRFKAQTLISSFLTPVVALTLTACGSSEDTPSGRDTITDLTSTIDTRQWGVQAFAPISIALASESDANPNVLVQTQRSLLPHEYDALQEPEFVSDRQHIASVITGIGLNVVDLQNNNLTLGLAIEAREFLANGKGGNFSPTTRIFAAQGEDLTSSQNFAILNSDSPNYLMTGLAFRLKEARIKNLVLQRKAVSQIMSEGDPLTAAKTLILPPGWAAVGIVVKIVPKIPEGKTIFDVKIPYIQDALLYVGQWGLR